MKKALTVNKMYRPEIGGVEIVAESIAKLLKKNNYESKVLTYNNINKLRNDIIDEIEVQRLPTIFQKGPVRWSNKYKKSIKKESVNSDIIIFHFPSFQPEIDLLFRNKYRNAKKICFYHADIVGRGFIGNIYNQIITHNFLKKMDKIIVTSPNMKISSKYLEKFQDKIEVIPLFVDTDHFYYREKNKREFLINELKNKKEKIIIYIGRLGRYKGLDYLIESFKELDKKNGLVIIGKGPKEEELKAKVNELNLENEILFLDHVTYKELPEYYSAADLFVLPSIDRGEAFGLVVTEAMACGVPVITTELGTGTSFHNFDGITGKVIEPKNSMYLTKAIEEILNNPKKYKKENIINRAKDFSFEKFEKNVEEKIIGVIKK
ncbi:N-acetyllactosaminide 3-alpha-galactosyltransferase/rhamnosyl/mannosyltransferase [Oceanotoga teriensis]|uniref:N-acetyllactosaminide 3-alpha-galactosyltransferase/rhamnosyl/mannosyltransferase n=1 Tax=Oceanotoga teriensis TaxID=515440 RepID=A0AA45C549_9BACT|nr:glycosyltransferase [Oceanotoga teriensis]PWJ88102.1 N-acetyllactosaminide 3-alpha-galactosyltransferase/rhamnosyl/mannosyltransferase [Oceanotoga teriensis]